jgi:hypothetical protein
MTYPTTITLRRPTLRNVTVTRTHINSQGYDSSGRYWGTGQRLYCLMPSEPHHWLQRDRAASWASHEQIYMRAESAREARERLAEEGFFVAHEDT